MAKEKFEKLKNDHSGYLMINSPSLKFKEQSLSDEYEGYTTDWQFRISIFPSKENLNKAGTAIADFIDKKNLANQFEIKCLLLNGNHDSFISTMRDWDPANLTGRDRNQRGKEVCVYIGGGTGRGGNFNYQKTAEDWKNIMFGLWKALQDAEVEIGYTQTPSGDKAVPSETGLLVPFSYTSFKPFMQRHRILNQTRYNPFDLKDPLEGMNEITWNDLSQYGIDRNTVQLQIQNRIDRARIHIKEMNQAIINKLFSIAEIEKYDEPLAPIKPDVETIEDYTNKLTGKAAIEEIGKIKEDFDTDNIKSYLESLKISNININNCIENAPSEMQKIYRGIVHTLHEQEALAHDLKHLENKSPKIAKEIFKDVGILAGGIVGSTGVGASIGALLGTFAFPGLGTIAGTAIGAAFGAAIGLAATGFQGLVRNRLVGGFNMSGESVASGLLTTLGATGTGALIGTMFFPGIGSVIGAGVGVVVGVLTNVTVAIIRWALSPEPSETLITDLNMTDFGDKSSSSEKNPYSNPLLKPDSSQKQDSEAEEYDFSEEEKKNKPDSVEENDTLKEDNQSKPRL